MWLINADCDHPKLMLPKHLPPAQLEHLGAAPKLIYLQEGRKE